MEGVTNKNNYLIIYSVGMNIHMNFLRVHVMYMGSTEVIE